MGDAVRKRLTGTRSAPTPVKIIVAGGTGVGKTALVRAMSEIAPLHVEAIQTVSVDTTFSGGSHGGMEPSVPQDEALDFGRITIDDALILYLFDTPEQNRRWALRDEVTVGALGAVVLADPNRLEECAPVIDYFERHGTPYVVAVSGGEATMPAGESQLATVRRALRVGQQVPVAHCDPSQRDSSRNVLITLLEHAKDLVRQRRTTAAFSA